MIKCSKCGSYKEPFFKYWRDKKNMGCSAGSACPTCEPHRVGIDPMPGWWALRFVREPAKIQTSTPTPGDK